MKLPLILPSFTWKMFFFFWKITALNPFLPCYTTTNCGGGFCFHGVAFSSPFCIGFQVIIHKFTSVFKWVTRFDVLKFLLVVPPLEMLLEHRNLRMLIFLRHSVILPHGGHFHSPLVWKQTTHAQSSYCLLKSDQSWFQPMASSPNQ